MAARRKKDAAAAAEPGAGPEKAAADGAGEPEGGARELTREDVAQRLLELYRRCLQAERVMTYDKDEKQWMLSDEWKVDARGAAMALEQLSELMGFGAAEKGTDGGAELRLSEEAAELAE